MPIALISVSNKEGIIEFAKGLNKAGWEIISTGGTFEVLKKASLKNLKKVEEITGFPEIMDGRVKTLHPKIFGGILADRSKADHLKEAKANQIPLIDLVVCNLYPFSEKPGIENIDIGGVSLLRAAAKNYQFVTVVCDPADYEEVLAKSKEPARHGYAKGVAGGARKQRSKTDDRSEEFRRRLALKAFNHTSRYDQMIADYFSGVKNLTLNFEKLSDLRYGENPHQTAAFYGESRIANRELSGIVNAEVLHGKELSFNNILDADAALNLIGEFEEPAAAVIKHTNPCGVATGKNINDAFKSAYQADALSAFGGVIVLNRPCTKEIAEEINKVFAEVVLAPEFEKGALEILKQKKNIRILKLPATPRLRSGQASYLPRPAYRTGRRQAGTLPAAKDYKKVIGGILEQDYDSKQITEKDLKIVSQEKPTKSQINDLLFAWKVAKHVKSNAVVIAKAGITLGIGAGQMSRIDSVDIAIKKGQGKLKGAVVASDGFFPFKDSVDKLAKFGILSIIQPGGSVKDKEVITAADRHSLSMVFTGIRAFRH